MRVLGARQASALAVCSPAVPSVTESAERKPNNNSVRPPEQAQPVKVTSRTRALLYQAYKYTIRTLMITY